MNHKLTTLALVIPSIFATNVLANTDTSDIEVLTINGDFRTTSIQKNTTAVSLLSADDIRQLNAQNLEEIIALAPNVNFAGGTQRARYYQIRGIGERSQFQEPINPSVGIMIDGVDFTGIGSVSSMFDVAQTEIFRGPQGTRFGANALAGIINITTNAPADVYEGSLKATVGNYGSRGLGVVVSGPANDIANYRFSAEQYKSDGFMDNEYLNRDNTNNRDELSLRGKLAIQATNDLKIDISVMHFDFDNGYDAFSLNNNRKTYSDEPGFDTQKTTAIATTFTYDGLKSAQVQLLTSYADSELGYAYDDDWAFGQYSSDDYLCITPTGCFHTDSGYSGFDYYQRNKENASAELRLISKPGAELFSGSTSWVTGVYYKNEQSDLLRQYTFNDTDFLSDFDTNTYAIFGQLDTQLTKQLVLTTGLRVEQREADYRNSDDFSHKPSDTMVGGKVVLSYQATADVLVFTSINRGYKAGGINTDGTLADELRTFEPEYVMNYELGLNTSFLNNRAYLRATAFLMDRKDVQVKISNQIEGTPEFIEYLDNASDGTNLGLEIESGWYINDRFDVHASVGFLETEYKAFTYQTEDGEVSLSGRSQAHAPSYQFNIGLNTQVTDKILLNVSIEGKDDFYFSDSHDKKSDPYELLNISLRYTENDWDVSLWARNVANVKYKTRGFFWGIDPRIGYADQTYFQLGEPRVFGATFNYHF